MWVCNPFHSWNLMAQAAQQRSKTGSVSAPLAPEPPFPTVPLVSKNGGFKSKHSGKWGTTYSDYSAI